MPKIKDSISVKVQSKSLPEGNKVYGCELVVPICRLQVAELLVTQGAIESLEKRLKRVCLEEVSVFLGEAKCLLSGLKKVRAKGKTEREAGGD
jgi:hypothetical protein